METAAVTLRDELLAPIAGPNPGGVALRYDPLYDRVKEARREDEDIPQGDWQTTRKTADWPLVIRLTKDALSTKSKDVQLAVWLTEAMLRREGFAGLRDGLDVIVGMLEQHWEHLHPAIEDGDLEMRAGPLEWLGLKLDVAVRRVPLDRAGHDWLRMQEIRGVPTESEAANDSAKAELRETLVAEGRLTPEELERAFAATPKAFYKTLNSDLDGALAALQNLDDVSEERFGNDAPSYARLRAALEEVQRTTRGLLRRKLELEPESDASTNGASGAGANGTSSIAAEMPGVAIPAGASHPGTMSTASPGAPLTSREDAAARIAAAAKFLRAAEPANPAAYLLLRGFRWGELRATGRTPDPRLLEAPATATRTQLKSLLLDAKWEALLDTAEHVMATPQGRGWIDLQRYAITACDQLGTEYQLVGTALRGALRALVADLPGLLDMTLMDDTPTANAETRAWLRGILERAEASADRTPDEAVAPNGYATRDARSAALAEVRAGRTDRAIQLLMAQTGQEKTKRNRFLNQTELASIMVDAGHELVAMPILEELMVFIEAHRLEEWEEGAVVARPMALLYRCLQKTDGDPGTRQALYLRICRLDPLQAIGFAQS